MFIPPYIVGNILIKVTMGTIRFAGLVSDVISGRMNRYVGIHFGMPKVRISKDKRIDNIGSRSLCSPEKFCLSKLFVPGRHISRMEETQKGTGGP
jgi:hypothetical protein